MRKNISTSGCSALAAKNCFISGVCSGDMAFLGDRQSGGDTGPGLMQFTGPPSRPGSATRRASLGDFPARRLPVLYVAVCSGLPPTLFADRSEEHTSELQSLMS